MAGHTVGAGAEVSRFWLPALSVNLPAATPTVPTPLVLATGVKVAVYSV